MTARAEAAAATGERILDATEHLFWDEPLERISLDAVAERAGVAVQTVIRRYGSKDQLIAAAAARATERVRDQRNEAPAGDVPGAVSNLLDHYEELGDRALRILAAEGSGSPMRDIAEGGRRLHREWVARTFAPQLSRRRGAKRARRSAQLVAVTDVYTWKLLRRDAGLSRAETQRALEELISGLEEESR